ncbi:MAG: CPBP family intramembrane glutamic endopeptidase [Pseudomonadota bacterium]
MFRLLKQYLPDIAWNRENIGWLLFPVVVAFALLAFDRYGIQRRFYEIWGEALHSSGMSIDQVSFFAQFWLTGSCIVLMVAIPVVYLFCFPARDGNEWGLSFNKDHWPVYVTLFLFMLPIVWVASTQPSFMHFYPLYNPANLQLFIVFELVYLAQFFCVEFFFRGPLLLKLNERFGYAAIGMMAVPYALIHIYKPFPEALGSIIAGLVLGYVAIRLRSIWPGVFLHCGVALSMDIFALVQSGRWVGL